MEGFENFFGGCFAGAHGAVHVAEPVVGELAAGPVDAPERHLERGAVLVKHVPAHVPDRAAAAALKKLAKLASWPTKRPRLIPALPPLCNRPNKPPPRGLKKAK